MTWRAIIVRCYRFMWRIELEELDPAPVFPELQWRRWEREDGGPFAIGTERHAHAKAARLVRRRERARARMVGGRTIVLPRVPSGPAPGALPDPTTDRHRAFED